MLRVFATTAVHHDAVLAIGGDDHLSETGVGVRHPARITHPQVPRVDTLRHEQRSERRAVRIVPSRTDHRDRRTHARRGDRLVQTFAARQARQRFTDDGLTGARQLRHARDEVRVEAAADDDFGAHFPSSFGRSPRPLSSPASV